MNCQTFEPTVNDLARGRMMEANAREDALAHAEECARCSVRLAAERALSQGLRAYASSVEGMSAPAQLETKLREAFRQRQAAITDAPASAKAAGGGRPWTVWATAAAAAILTVCAIQAFRLREATAPLHTANDSMSLSAIRTPRPAPTKATPTNGATSPDELVEAKDERLAQASGPKSAAGQQAVAVRYMAASSRGSRQSRPALTSKAAPEIVTEFMPLTYGAALSPSEGGQLVRVELPRSALASLGFPMNVERPDERVKADVFLGHDGLARAIRFVR
ncbi:MAG: hypothetical protein QOF02_1922 [Blastocatellia bacterium]|jgi:hypothetical protein|nr:hypothetical protein [Blastocatellia bacterium]